MMRSLSTIATTLGIIGFSLGASASHAISADIKMPENEPKNWALQISPYLWMTGLNGDISPFKRAPTISIDQNFNDVLKSLNFAGFIEAYYRRDNWIFQGDLMYVDTTDKKATGHHTINLSPFYPGTHVNLDKASIKVKSQIFNSTLTAGYRFVDQPQFSIDLLGGVRIWNISNDVTLKVAADAGGPVIEEHYRIKKSFGWVDPVVAVRGFITATERISLLLNADIGGFGAGSKFSWQAMATVNYNFTDNWTGSIGYKHLAVNYDRNGHVFDTRLSGPVMALTYRF